MITKGIALEMAEAFCTECMNDIGDLVDQETAEKIVEHLWDELELARHDVIALGRDCRRLRDELDEANGVIR